MWVIPQQGANLAEFDDFRLKYFPLNYSVDSVYTPPPSSAQVENFPMALIARI